MRRRNPYLKKNHRPWFWLDTALGYCFIALFSFVSVLEQTSDFASVPVDGASEVQGHTFLLSNDDLLARFDHPIDLPLESNPTPKGSETPDENESTDSFDDTPDKLFSGSHDTKLSLHSGDALLSQLQLSIESRSKVSLIILHHSWKSFLI